jgi:SAM-dependent MidA family methyltransferase
MFFDSAKDSQAKHFATANELLDVMPVIANQRSFEARLSKLDRNRAKYANGSEKLSQIIEKVYSERYSWARAY